MDIAVVGDKSSGKSTFINALMGKQITTHTTTRITKYILKSVPGTIFGTSHIESIAEIQSATAGDLIGYDAVICVFGNYSIPYMKSIFNIHPHALFVYTDFRRKNKSKELPCPVYGWEEMKSIIKGLFKIFVHYDNLPMLCRMTFSLKQKKIIEEYFTKFISSINFNSIYALHKKGLISSIKAHARFCLLENFWWYDAYLVEYLKTTTEDFSGVHATFNNPEFYLLNLEGAIIALAHNYVVSSMESWKQHCPANCKKLAEILGLTPKLKLRADTLLYLLKDDIDELKTSVREAVKQKKITLDMDFVDNCFENPNKIIEISLI